MFSDRKLDKMTTSIARLGRNELTKQIKHFRGRFRLDFTDDFLQKTPVERLRHILLAAVINTKNHN
ncbi:MAG: hypothetical protein PHF37_10525 [Phycisphaerae bacterium]|nr:hypothetical protein [Phycisphaerae bacterium]